MYAVTAKSIIACASRLKGLGFIQNVVVKHQGDKFNVTALTPKQYAGSYDKLLGYASSVHMDIPTPEMYRARYGTPSHMIAKRCVPFLVNVDRNLNSVRSVGAGT